ncbi:MAG: hypothetical protein Q8898_02360 [Bacillota bacterium]|nr:hypothetical protein [Bacillota bacterium]
MRRKNINKRILLISLCLHLMLLTSLFSQNASAQTADTSLDGFIIQADRVIGSGMVATIVNQETASNTSKPMLRFHYASATIYGMKLTKELQTPQGIISVTLKADGPVTMNGMTVDASAITFKGACLQALTPIPEAGLENVVMVAHYMNAEDSNINQLTLKTITGNAGPEKPNEIKMLQDLATLPVNELDSEIGKITSGHLPLMCGDNKMDNGNLGSIGGMGQLKQEDGLLKPVDPTLAGLATKPLNGLSDSLQHAVDGLTAPLQKTVGGLTDPLQKTVGGLTDTLQKGVGRLFGPLQKTVGEAAGALQEHSGALRKPLQRAVGETKKLADPVVKTLDKGKLSLNSVQKPVTGTLKHVIMKTQAPHKPVLGQVISTTGSRDSGPNSSSAKGEVSPCNQLKDANGTITKELALKLIDEASKNKIPITELCKNDASMMDNIKKWQDGWQELLGLFDLFGQDTVVDPLQELSMMREKITKEKDGTIIYKPQSENK